MKFDRKCLVQLRRITPPPPHFFRTLSPPPPPFFVLELQQKQFSLQWRLLWRKMLSSNKGIQEKGKIPKLVVSRLRVPPLYNCQSFTKFITVGWYPEASYFILFRAIKSTESWCVCMCHGKPKAIPLRRQLSTEKKSNNYKNKRHSQTVRK